MCEEITETRKEGWDKYTKKWIYKLKNYQQKLDSKIRVF
jgi:hypothetical protein